MSFLSFPLDSLLRLGFDRWRARWLGIVVLAGFASAVDAAEPVEPPPQPVQLEGPDITLIEAEDRAIFEYRLNGRLTMVRVVPNIGAPYYLVPKDPTRGWDDLERADGLVPQWVLFRF